MTTSLRHHPIAAQRERNARIREHAERIAVSSQTSLSAGSARALLPVAVVPANSRETTRLPQRNRREFLRKLAMRMRVAFTAEAPGKDTTLSAEMLAARACAEDAPPRESAEASAILGFSCATCRGECCTAGGDHAFLREDSLTRVRLQNPLASESELMAVYASHLPARNYRGSCVYHTTGGCALPRALRSNICNRYLCGGLTQLKRALESSGSNAAFVGAADSVHLRRMAVIDASGVTPVSLREKDARSAQISAHSDS